MGMANLLLHEGNLDGAAAQYERLMQVYQMQSNFDPKLAANADLVIAARFIHHGDAAGAITALNQAKRWDPTNARIDEMIARASATTHPASTEHVAP
jgi:ATP/maltotriose-dependent transcriptional regulator MalT